MTTLRLFASAREAAGCARDEFSDVATVGDVLAKAVSRYGEGFARLLPTCRVWVNGEPASHDTTVASRDEVAVLPPVSGG
jgi:molybdopterin converting factor small subunit